MSCRSSSNYTSSKIQAPQLSPPVLWMGGWAGACGAFWDKCANIHDVKSVKVVLSWVDPHDIRTYTMSPTEIIQQKTNMPEPFGNNESNTIKLDRKSISESAFVVLCFSTGERVTIDCTVSYYQQ